MKSGLLSKVHVTLIYNKLINNWDVYDGEINKCSTNGVW